MVDLSQQTIENIFFEQVRDLSQKTYGADPRLRLKRFSATDLFQNYWMEV